MGKRLKQAESDSSSASEEELAPPPKRRRSLPAATTTTTTTTTTAIKATPMRPPGSAKGKTGPASKKAMNLSDYGNAHRKLLQFLIATRVTSEGALQRFWGTLASSLDRPDSKPLSSLHEAILLINRKLNASGLQMRVKRREQVELGGGDYDYVVVHESKDTISTLSTPFASWELEVLSAALYHAVQDQGDGTFTAEDLVPTLVRRGAGKSNLAKIKEALQNALDSGWLLRLDDESEPSFTPSVRCLMEMKEFISKIPGAYLCPKCDEYVLRRTPEYEAYLTGTKVEPGI